MSDLDTLVEMGFEKPKAELALKNGGNLQGAIDWLERNQDKTIEELQEEQAASLETDGGDLKPGETPQSLVCNDCGKKFRSQEQAEFHASKTQHMNFAESTEEVAPLTEEEKAQRLSELREKMAAKKALLSEQDKKDQKRNEEIRRKSTKEQHDIREELQRKEQLKEAQAKKKEKQDEIDAKKRIQAKIAADKEERRQKAEQAKAMREGQTFPAGAVAENLPQGTPIPQPPATSKPASAYTETRLRLQTSAGTVQKSFPVETTLFEVAHAVAQEKSVEVTAFQQNFPKKVYEQEDFGMTLKEAGMVPSAALIVK